MKQSIIRQLESTCINPTTETLDLFPPHLEGQLEDCGHRHLSQKFTSRAGVVILHDQNMLGTTVIMSGFKRGHVLEKYIFSASVQLSHLKDYRIKDLILKGYVQPCKIILFTDM
jgi:hypothetical protein